MRFNPGDKVWVRSVAPSKMPAGEHEGVVVRYNTVFFDHTYPYIVDVPACPYPLGGRLDTEWVCQECDLRPRGDSQKREDLQLGDWDLCPWKPETVKAIP